MNPDPPHLNEVSWYHLNLGKCWIKKWVPFKFTHSPLAPVRQMVDLDWRLMGVGDSG